jgi:hypothetical protein
MPSIEKGRGPGREETKMRQEARIHLNSIIHHLLRDLAIGLDDNLVNMQRGLDGVWLFIDVLKLLQSTALRLDAESEDKLASRCNNQAAVRMGTHQKRYQRMLSRISQPTKM